VHKLRNVLSYLPEHLHAEYRRKITAAWAMRSYEQALEGLRRVVRELEGINSSAAGSLDEGLEETLTVHRLEMPEMLGGSLRSTNMIESMFSGARQRMKNVRRWRSVEQSSRWTAAALLEAEKMFRRIKGCADMPKLVSALNAIVTQ
jgi:transposase-like protein